MTAWMKRSNVGSARSTFFRRPPTTVGGQGRWHPLTRVAFRFCVVYFGLFSLWFAQIAFVFTGIVGQWLPDNAIMWQMDQLEPVTRWVGRHVFGIDAVLRHSGSGDQAAIWMMVFCILTIAAVATAVWTLVDRRRADYTQLWRGSSRSCDCV
jgi:hypothetical protein